MKVIVKTLEGVEVDTTAGLQDAGLKSMFARNVVSIPKQYQEVNIDVRMGTVTFWDRSLVTPFREIRAVGTERAIIMAGNVRQMFPDVFQNAETALHHGDD